MHAIRKNADGFKENTQQQIPSLEKVEPKTKKEKKRKRKIMKQLKLLIDKKRFSKTNLFKPKQQQ